MRKFQYHFVLFSLVFMAGCFGPDDEKKQCGNCIVVTASDCTAEVRLDGGGIVKFDKSHTFTNVSPGEHLVASRQCRNGGMFGCQCEGEWGFCKVNVPAGMRVTIRAGSSGTACGAKD